MITKREIEKTIVNLLFSLFIQFSAIEIRWVFSHAKLMISWLQWLEKKVRCPCSLVSYSQFFNWLSSISRHVFNVCVHEGARARGRAKWCHELCAERMRNANVRNYLKLFTRSGHVVRNHTCRDARCTVGFPNKRHVKGGLVQVALFWKSHCATCVLECVILYHI